MRGYLEERGSVDKRELHGRFVAGSGVGSANLRRHCVERTWEDQLGELSLLAMFSAIGLYEGWVSALEIGTAEQRRRLQFPSRGVAGRTTLGVGDTVRTLRLNLSSSLDLIYGVGLQSSSRYLPARLDDMLVIYRCFKEIRNAFAHAGRMPNNTTELSYKNAVPRIGGLGRNGRDLQLPEVMAGQQVSLSLLNVQALCALLLNIVVTLDADLATTKAAEKTVIDQWRKAYKFTLLPGDALRRKSRLKIMNAHAGLPDVTDTESLYVLLKTARLVL